MRASCLMKPAVFVLFFFVAVFSPSPAAADSWEEKNNGLDAENIRALAIDPNDSNTVYAGTDGGVFKTTDAGATWSEINTGLTNFRVEALAMDPNDPATVYAGTYEMGVLKTTDEGANWSEVNNGLTNFRVEALAINPDNPSTVYAGTYGGGVFKTTDAGADWSETGLVESHDRYVSSLAIDPATPSTVYVGVYNGGVFKTTDAGANWSKVNTSLDTSLMCIADALAINPNNPSTVYTGIFPGGVFKTTDGGANWSETGLTDDVSSLAIDPDNPSTVYAGTHGGVYKTTDAGANWSETGLMLSVYSLAIDPNDPASVYAGTMGRGVWKYSRGSGTTIPAGETVDNTGATIENPDMGENSQIIGGTVTGNITGETGSVITNALIDADTISGVTIGAGCTLTQSSAKANPGIDLLNAAKDDTGQLFVLDHALIKENDGDLKTPRDLIKDEADAFLGDTTTATHPEAKGTVSITADKLGDLFVPAQISALKTTSESDNIYFGTQGDLMVAKSGAVFTLSPYPADDQAFAQGLTGAGWSGEVDAKGVAVLDLGQAFPMAYRFSILAALPNGFSMFSAGSTSFEFQTGDQALHTYTLLVTYPDGCTQAMSPAVHDIPKLSDWLNQFGLSHRFNDNGTLDLLGSGGKTAWRCMPDRALRTDDAGVSGIQVTGAGDLDGNGIVDFEIKTDKGSQYIYSIPF